MKERLDKILMLVVYFYSVVCIASLFTCGLVLGSKHSAIYGFINDLAFNVVAYNYCKPVYFDYLQFLILGMEVKIEEYMEKIG